MENRVVVLGLIFLLLSTFSNFASSLADMPNPAPREHNVEIQGAKVISEGGYLWFRVTNHEESSLYVSVYFPSDVNTIEKIEDPYLISSNESINLYFQVPYYWSGIAAYLIPNFSSSSREIAFSFELFNLYQDVKIGSEIVDFRVQVVRLEDYGREPTNMLALASFSALTVLLLSALILALKRRAG